MKKTLLFFLTIFYISFNAQNSEFSINDDGLTKFVVTSIPGINKQEAYTKTINWLNKNVNTPEKSIKGTIENDYVRFEAVSHTAMRWGRSYLPIKYQIEISFKDNRYKFEVIELLEENYMFPRYSNTPFVKLDLSKSDSGGYNTVRKSNGEFRSRYEYASDIAVYFNYLNTKLKEYITNTGVNKDDNW